MNRNRAKRSARSRPRGPRTAARAWLAAGGGAVLLVLAGCGPDEPAKVAEPAEPAAPVVREWSAGALRAGGGPGAAGLGPGETHEYRLSLEAGQFLRLSVEQEGVDAVVRLRDPEGELLLEADRRIDDRGPELVMAVARVSGPHTLAVHAGESTGPGRYDARIESLRPASGRDRLAAATYRTFRRAYHLPPEEAIEAWAGVLATWRELGETVLEGEVLSRIGLLHQSRGEREAALERYLDAADAFARAGDRRWEAILRGYAAAALQRLGRVEEMVEQHRIELHLGRAVGDRWLQADAHNGLGLAFRSLGEVQTALDHYEAALDLWPEDDRDARAHTLHNLAILHHLYFQDPERSRRQLEGALELWNPAFPTYGRNRARTLNQLGRLALEQGKPAAASRHLEAALEHLRPDDRCRRASTLSRLALATDALGDGAAANRRLAEALDFVDGGACPADRTAVYLRAAELAETRGDATAAAERYERCHRLFAARGDRTGEAESLAGIARAQRALGDERAALEASRRALAILEGVRPTLLREDLRTAYFSTGQETLDLHIGLLMAAGSSETAWEAAERGRARALRDALIEAGAGVRGAAEPALADQERELQKRLNVLEQRRTTNRGAEPAAALLGEIDALAEELETVRGEIRRSSPAYSALTETRPVSLAGVRRELLERNTLLLEYRLGAETSWLWAISRESFGAFELPPGEEVETVAREALHWTRSPRWPQRNPPPVCELARTVLGPVAEELDGRRLVVVADGVLEEVSFAALPHPADPARCPDAPLLVTTHEIVHLPSASALVAQRRLLAGREPAPGWLAMVADPVYGPDDPRLGATDATRRASRAPSSRAAGGSAPRFERLDHAGEEADAVLAVMPPTGVHVARGLDASKESVTGGSLAGHRIVHFATHGVLDPERPLHSFLALSERTADGKAVDGALYAREIYDLDLPAELVVLSACDTARGRQIRGEGLVSGLPRAFLYAGAARVLVSLWPVPDRSTRDLMELFYRGLIEEGLPPGRALQEAQRSLWLSGRPPYQWAGFVLQGDWRPLAPF